MTDRYRPGARVAVGDVPPTAPELNALLEERDRLAAQVAELTVAASRWSAPAPLALPRRTLRKALDVLGIDPGTFTALILTPDGTARIELTRESGERDVIHVPLTDDVTPESVPMVPVVEAATTTVLPVSPPTAPFDWTGTHKVWPTPAVDPRTQR